MNEQESAILRDIVFYDLFSQPRTLLELSSVIPKGPSLGELNNNASDVLNICDHLIARGILTCSNGFYQLADSPDYSRERLHRNAISIRKLRSIRRLLPWICSMPGVHAVFLCNSMALFNCTMKSDIDFLVITEPQRIFTARFWTVLFSRLFSHRPHEQQAMHGAETLCFSFFVTSDHLDFSSIQLPDGDIYLDHWIQDLIPMYDPLKLYERIRQHRQISTPLYVPSSNLRVQLRWYHRIIHRLLSFCTHLLPESLLAKFEWWYLPEHLKQLANQSSDVVWSSQMLKFHDQDRRREFRDRFQKRLGFLV